MKILPLLAGSAVMVLALVPVAPAQTPAPAGSLGGVDGRALTAQLQEREEKIRKLSAEEQAMLRAAQQRATEDPAVKDALEARDKAMAAFQTALLASMVKSDPEVGRILEKMQAGAGRGY